ncbi:VWA domain-containing protein [Streptomyces sp. CB02400]|uniref:VWA domain-containing protein n=1 Tax=Streptomyces sp. CB02400 TaxID=1703944 RepID=UPI00093BF947|nr:VWA domain-containing protein [Streptomyces sp. CB02400]OKK10123.1 Toxic cation resistance protein [Streptomyces sp. CB02400]
MGILTLLRNAFGRSRKARSAEAEGAADAAETASTSPASPTPTKPAPKVPSPSPEPTPAPRTASVPEPREEHDLVSAAFDNITVPKPTRSDDPTAPAQEAKATPEPDPAPEPKAEPEPEARQEPTPEPAAEAEPEAEPTAEAEAKPEATTEAEPEPAAKAEPEAEAEAELTSTAEAEAKPEATTEAEPEPAAKAEPEVEAEVEEKPEAVTEPAAADGEDAPQGPPAPDDESSTGGAGGNESPAEGEAEAAPEPEAEPTAEAEAKPEATTEAELKTEPEAEVEGEAEQPTPKPAPATPPTKLRNTTLTTAYKAAGATLKKHDLTGTRAKIYLVLDRSASMRPYYKDGSAQALAEQTLALAAHVDTEATLHVTFFSTELDGTGELTLTDHENKIDELHAGLGRMGRTSYHAAVEAVLTKHAEEPAGTPALVVFQTDGAPDAKTPATQALTDAAKNHPTVFFSFVAFGEHDNKAFDYLRKLKTENTSFFHAGPTPRELTDKELYEGVLASWRP